MVGGPAPSFTTRLRAVLAEDQALLRVGLTRILEAGGIEVVETVDNAPGLARALGRDDIDVAVVDVRLPPTFTTEGLEAAVTARERRPGLPVLVLSQFVEALYARDLLASGTGAARPRPLARLTAREQEVLALMAEGRSNAAIAARMFVTEKAVGKHTNNIFAKLDLPPAPDDNRRVLAVLAWLDGS